MSSNPATEKPLEILPRDTTTSVPTPITNEIASTINQPSGIADNMNDHAPSEKTPATEESSEVKISNAVESIRDENDNPGGDHIRTSQPIDTPKDLVDSVTSNPELAGPAVDKKASTTQPSSSVEKSDIKASSDGDVNDEHPRASIECGKDLYRNRGLRSVAGPDQVHTVYTTSDLLWQGTPQVINYYFMDGNIKQRQKVINTVEEWTWYANVHFVETNNKEDSNVRIKFDPNDGSWSYVGTQSNRIAIDMATMNLAWLDKASNITDIEKAVILHEFGHVLGLLHEHQSPAHGGTAVTNIKAALELYSRTQGWSEKEIYEQVIDVYASSDVSNFSQVDIHSIMHYPQPKELTGGSVDIGYNTKLTDLDKAYMMLQYPRPRIHPIAKIDGWSYEKALSTIGAPPEITKQVLGLLESDRNADTGEITPYNIRKTIEVWCRSKFGAVDNPAHSIDNPGLVPAHDVDKSPARAADGPAVDDKGPSFVKLLYDELKKLYCPGGGQYFALQYPTRYLDKQSFAYKLDGNFSRFNKPIVVNEAEFALTDALYPIAQIVGGPNGQTLSRNYSKALNSLVPTFDTREVREQREKMRQWLLKETKSGNAAFTVDTRLTIPGIDNKSAQELSTETGVTVVVGNLKDIMVDQVAAKKMARDAIDLIQKDKKDTPRGMTRIEYSDTLMQDYLSHRQEWEIRRDKLIEKASDLALTDPQAMEKLTREVAHISAIEQAKLSSKYADAVVRGYSHTVRGFMGHLDVKSVAESLQDAKDAMRESALSSVYTASAVYPVAMQPADWFEALDTGFTREDLSQDPELIRASIQAKGQLIDNLDNQIANLRAFSAGDPAESKAAMDEAARKRDAAMGKLSQAYTASSIAAVKLAIDVAVASSGAGAGVQSASKVISKMSSEKKTELQALFGGDSKVLDEIGKQMDDVAKANDEVNAASRLLTEHMSAYSIAMAGDTRTMIDGLQRKLTTAKSELADLQQSFTIAQRSKPITDVNAKSAKLEDVGKLPSGNGGSRWSEIHISTAVNNDYTKTDTSNSSSVSSFRCNFWLGSAAGNSSQSEAANSVQTLGKSFTVDISMRVAYVTVDRSGWFDPSFLEMSSSFMKSTKDENYVPWSQWKAGTNTAAQAASNLEESSDSHPTGYLAAFPVGYVLGKDTVIKVTSNNTDSKAFKSQFDKAADSSGGFLCFSNSSASRSSASSNASSTVATSNGVVIRIAGPQILGYIMQLTAKDQTKTFQPTATEEIFLEDNPESLSNGTKAKIDPGAAHGMNPVSKLDPTKFANGIPKSERSVRGYDDDSPGVAPGSSGSSPAHGISGPDKVGDVKTGPGSLIDAIKMALDDKATSEWFGSQSEVTKDELLATFSEVLGKVKVANSK